MEGNVAQQTSAIARQFETLDGIIKSVQRSINDLVSSMRGMETAGTTAANAWREAASAMERAATAASRAAGSVREGGAMPPALGFEPGLNGYVEPPERRGGFYPPYPLGGGAPTIDGTYTEIFGNRLPAGVSTRSGGSAYGPFGRPPGVGGVPIPVGGPPGAGGAGGGLGGGGFGPGGPHGPAGGGFGGYGPYGFPYGGFPYGGGPGGPYGPAGGGTGGGAGRGGLNHGSLATGAAEMGAGAYGGWKVLQAIAEPTVEKGDIESGLLRMGLTPEQVKSAEKAAIETQVGGAKGSSEIGNLALVSKLMAVVQDPEAAIKLMPAYARLGAVLDASGHGNEGDALMSAIRAAEYRGDLMALDPKTGKEVVSTDKLGAFLRNVMAVNIASHGQIGPAQLYQFEKSGGILAATMSDEALFADSMAIQLSMGSSGAGRGLQAFGQQFSAGRMSQAGYHLLQDMDVVSRDPNTARRMGFGQYMLLPGAMDPKILQLARDHSVEFVLDYLYPKIKSYDHAHYGAAYDLPSVKDPEERSRLQLQMDAALMEQVASRIPGGNYAVEAIRNFPLIQRDRDAIRKAQGRDAYAITASTNPSTDIKQFQAALQGLEIALGDSALKPATDALNSVSAGINTLAQVMKQHPEATKTGLEMFASGVALFGAGTAAATALLILGSPAGPFVAVAAGTIALCEALKQLDKVLHHLFPWIFGGENGDPLKKFQTDVAKGGFTDHWWWPMPSGGKREPVPEGVKRFFGFGSANAAVMPPSSNQTQKVYVEGGSVAMSNTHDIGRGSIMYLANQSRLPASGYSGIDLRLDGMAGGLQAGTP